MSDNEREARDFMLNGWISSILNWRESIRMYADSWGFVNLKLTKSDQMADFWVSSIGELTKRIRFEEVCELLVNCGIDEVGSLIPGFVILVRCRGFHRSIAE